MALNSVLDQTHAPWICSLTRYRLRQVSVCNTSGSSNTL